MKAARFQGNERIELYDAACPALGRDEVLLKVAYCGLCGSDKKPYRDGHALIPGHEVSGTVVDGNGTSIPVGTRAAAYLSVFCGRCEFCTRGLTNNCVHREGLLGWSDPWNGGYAEYMAVPARDVLPLHDSVSLQAGVLLLDTIGTSWHALRLADVQATSKVLVIGCGPLGLGAISGAVAFGAAEVFASDLVSFRREAARDLGAVSLTPEEVSCLEGIDVIIEAAGTPATLMQAVRIVAPQGRVVMLGEIWKPWTFEPDADTMLKDYSLIRSWYFPISEFAENQQYLIDQKVDVDKLISHTMQLDDLQEAFRLFFSGQSRKVLAAS